VSAAVDEEMADGEEAAPDASEAPGMVARGVEDG
jgi:hypothetical protein